MFTGIITDIGRIRKTDQRGDLRLEISCGFAIDGVDLGASIACSGVCLTVVDKGTDDEGRGWFAVDLSAETLARTAPNHWRAGCPLNLERALKIGDELGGHIVTGHIDGVGEVVRVSPSGDSTEITVRAPAELARFIAAKGSIALDGVSLTVNSVEDGAGHVDFTINLIPHTAEVTTFAKVAVGDTVNIEIDSMARYLGRMMEARG